MGNGADMREYVDTAVVPGAKEKSLLDTGATMNAICSKLLAEYGLSDKVDSSKAGLIQLADGTKVKSEGSISVQVEVGGKNYHVEYKVTPNLRPRIIYGAGFLDTTGILQNFRDAVKNHFNGKGEAPKN